MSPPPLGTGRVVWVLFRVAARQWRNRVWVRLSARRASRPGPGGRKPTPRRTPKWGVLGWLLAVLMVLGVTSWYVGLVGRLAVLLDRPTSPGAVFIRQSTFDELRKAEVAFRSGPRVRTETQPVGPAEIRRAVLKSAQMPFWFEAHGSRRSKADADRWQQQMRERYVRRGLAGFRPGRENVLANVLGAQAWSQPDQRRDMMRALALTLTCLFFMLLFKAFSAANADLKDPTWTVEWLLTFPIDLRGVFLARVLHVSVLNAFSWLFLFPFFLVAYISAGRYVLALPAAVAATLAVNLILGGVQVIGETWLRQTLSPSRRSNVMGLCTILQTLLLMATLLAAAAPEAAAALLAIARKMPAAALYGPLCLGLQVCRPGWAAWGTLAGMFAAAVAFAVLAGHVSERMVRGGLTKPSTAPDRRRTPAGTLRKPGRLFRGMLGKELLLLARDRSFLCQTVVLPVLICLFQLVLNRHLLRAATSSQQHATALAFGTGAYVMLASGASLLVSELRSLWMLYSLPHRLERLLLRKVSLWSMVGVVFTAAVLVAASNEKWHWDLQNTINAALALVGVAIVGAVSAGVAVLATDVSAERPRVAGTAVLLNMVLASMYLAAIYAESLWAKLIILTLFALVACAIWQKVRDRIGYLLDPTERPPPQLSLSDGLVAAFAFFAVQSLLVVILMKFPLETLDLLALTYTGAGAIVAPLSLLAFRRRRVPDLLRRVGLAGSADGRTSSRWPAAMLRGLAWGLAAAAFGIVYLMAVEQIAPLRRLKQQTPILGGEGGNALWILLLAVLVAPVLEEYLFRGLLYRGLQRSFHPAVAVAGSAAVFAVIHPPIAILPVFGLGVAAAISFRRTGLLLAPITTHVTYNLLVMAAAYVLK